MKTIIFSHGKESGPYGSKFKHLINISKELGFNTISIDYRDLINPEERVSRLIQESKNYEEVVLVGSSMGGYASIVASESINPLGLFLLAPAVYIPGYQKQEYFPKAKESHIIFGYNDEIIPVQNGIRLALENEMPITLIKSDHRLNSDLEYIGKLFKLFLEKINDTY